ncbi:MAG: TonB-dependent receptor [Polyangiaceae bacterium]|jgi:iron complex outermembrane receptor protein
MKAIKKIKMGPLRAVARGQAGLVFVLSALSSTKAAGADVGPPISDAGTPPVAIAAPSDGGGLPVADAQVPLDGGAANPADLSSAGSAGFSADAAGGPVATEPPGDAGVGDDGEAPEKAPGTSELGTITVTAQRRVNTVQKTPIAITAFSQDTIKQQRISTFKDLYGSVPGLLVPLTSTALTTQPYSMRGIGEIDTYPEPAVAVYVDDVYLARTVGSLYDTPDLERVEVLRGPQGTLYGRNSAAGAIRFITKDPTADRYATADVALGNYNDVNVKARVNGAILPNDLLNGAFSVVRHERQGYTWDVPLSQWVNNMDIWVVRGKLKSQFTDRLSLTLSGDGMWDRSTASYYTPINQPNGVPSGQQTNPDLTWADAVPLNRTTVYGGSATWKYEASDVITLKSVTAVRAMHGPIYYNNSGVTYIKGDSYAGFNENEETEELTFNADTKDLHAVVGLYYFNEFFHNNRVNQSAVGPVNNVGIIQHDDSRLYTQSYAAFGQTDYDFNDQLSATVGLRYTADLRSFQNIGEQQTNTSLIYPLPGNFNPNLFNTIFTGGAGFSQFTANAPTKLFDALTPKAALNYQVTPEALLYASFSEGFKSGGYDLRASTLNGSLTPYKPETILAYEAGFKSTFFSNHLTANLAAFYNHINEFQVRATSPGALGTPVNALINSGDAHSYGGELEVAINPFSGFTFGSSVAYLQTGYETFTASLPANVAGRTTLVGLDFPNAPTWQANWNFNYRLPLPTPGSWRIGAVVKYESGHYTDIYDTPQARVRPQAFLDGTINYVSHDERWSTGVSATNLLDLRRVQAVTYVPTNSGQYANWYAAYNAPRFVDVYATFKF